MEVEVVRDELRVNWETLRWLDLRRFWSVDILEMVQN